MADQKISAMTAASSLGAADVFPVVQSAASKKAAVSLIGAYLGANQYTVTYTLASVIGAAIANAGTGGTPGAATVTGTTGTGTKFQAAVTIGAGGTIESVNSISVAGAYTAAPTSPTNEPVTGGGLTGARLALGMSFAPCLVGSNASSGLAFNKNGEPLLRLANNAITLTATSEADQFQYYPGIEISYPNGSAGGLAMAPYYGATGTSYLDMFAYGSSAPSVLLANSLGVRGRPAPLTINSVLGTLDFRGGYDTGGNFNSAVILSATAAETFTGSAAGTKFTIGTNALGQAGTPRDRVVIDGAGNTKQQNGVFAVDTGGNDAGIAIGSLPGSPTLGMMAVVNDALAPAVGSVVAATGSAKALVWWNGAAWTVMGK